jgi:hypothetical protein
MEFVLTWNLVLLGGLILLFAYNFLLGQNATIKLILSMYIAVLTADGVARLFQEAMVVLSPGLQALIGSGSVKFFIFLRIAIFLLAIIIFVIKGGFHIHLEKHNHWAARTIIHGAFAILSAILFVSTILIYLSGSSFAEGIIYASKISIYQESLIAQMLIDYYQIWFSLPAIGFLLTSFFFPKATVSE